MNQRELVFCTGNKGKVSVACEHLAPLGFEVKQVDLDLMEIQSHRVSDVARHKAEQAYARVRAPLFVEDSGLFIDELKGWPGALTKVELATIGLEGILRMADLTVGRVARVHSAIAYIDDDGRTHVFDHESRVAGTLALTPAVVVDSERAWSDLWRVFIPSGFSQPLSALPEPDRERFFQEWSSTSQFAALGTWLTQQGSACSTACCG